MDSTNVIGSIWTCVNRAIVLLLFVLLSTITAAPHRNMSGISGGLNRMTNVVTNSSLVESPSIQMKSTPYMSAHVHSAPQPTYSTSPGFITPIDTTPRTWLHLKYNTKRNNNSSQQSTRNNDHGEVFHKKPKSLTRHTQGNTIHSSNSMALKQLLGEHTHRNQFEAVNNVLVSQPSDVFVKRGKKRRHKASHLNSVKEFRHNTKGRRVNKTFSTYNVPEIISSVELASSYVNIENKVKHAINTIIQLIHPRKLDNYIVKKSNRWLHFVGRNIPKIRSSEEFQFALIKPFALKLGEYSRMPRNSSQNKVRDKSAKLENSHTETTENLNKENIKLPQKHKEQRNSLQTQLGLVFGKIYPDGDRSKRSIISEFNNHGSKSKWPDKRQKTLWPTEKWISARLNRQPESKWRTSASQQHGAKIRDSKAFVTSAPIRKKLHSKYNYKASPKSFSSSNRLTPLQHENQRNVFVSRDNKHKAIKNQSYNQTFKMHPSDHRQHKNYQSKFAPRNTQREASSFTGDKQPQTRHEDIIGETLYERQTELVSSPWIEDRAPLSYHRKVLQPVRAESSLKNLRQIPLTGNSSDVLLSGVLNTTTDLEGHNNRSGSNVVKRYYNSSESMDGEDGEVDISQFDYLVYNASSSSTYGFVKSLWRRRFSWVDVVLVACCCVGGIVFIFTVWQLTRYCMVLYHPHHLALLSNRQQDCLYDNNSVRLEKMAHWRRRMMKHWNHCTHDPSTSSHNSSFESSISVGTQYETSDVMIASFITEELLGELNDQDSTCTSISDGFVFTHDYTLPMSSREDVNKL